MTVKEEIEELKRENRVLRWLNAVFDRMYPRYGRYDTLRN